MAINPTDAQRQTQADLDLALKLTLEMPLMRELNRLFNQIAIDLGVEYEATGTIISATEYETEINGIILSSNVRTSNAFSGRIVNEAVSDKTTEISLAIAAIAAFRGISTQDHLLRMRNDVRKQARVALRNSAVTSSKEIAQTLQKDIDLSVTKARTVEDASRSLVAATSKTDFKNRSLSRAATIATTETQRAAEGTKEIERGVFTRENSPLAASLAGVKQPKLFKVWMTRGDSKVRPAHVSADSQVAVDGFFSVGGELLRMPGDENGSASNTINCRCSAVDTTDQNMS
jgi:hypothetical protein